MIKRIRRTIWLLQSLIKRYKKQIAGSFVLGIIIFVALFYLLPVIKRRFYPTKEIVGVVGTYEPTRLPASVQNLISMGFTRINKRGEVEPLLATSWEVNKDGTRYLFHFKKGVLWHDGEEFTAFDVNYNFKDVTIAPADRYTLKLELSEPFSPLPSLLSRPLFKSGLIGLGPYTVERVDVVRNTVKSILLKKHNEKGESAYPSQGIEYNTSADLIEYRFYPNIERVILAFELGEIDRIENLTQPTLLANENNVNIEKKTETNMVIALFYNTENELFKEKEARQGLSYAVPDLDIDRLYSPIPPTSWAYNEKAKRYEYNKDKAQELLSSAGLTDREEPIVLTVFPEYLAMGQKIAASWKNFGVPTEVKVTRFFPDSYEVLLGVQEIPRDPDQYQLWHSTQEQTNVTHYNNPKIDKLLEEGRSTIDKDDRLGIYHEFQRFIAEDVPALFLTHPTIYTIQRK